MSLLKYEHCQVEELRKTESRISGKSEIWHKMTFYLNAHSGKMRKMLFFLLNWETGQF